MVDLKPLSNIAEKVAIDVQFIGKELKTKTIASITSDAESALSVSNCDKLTLNKLTNTKKSLKEIHQNLTEREKFFISLYKDEPSINNVLVKQKPKLLNSPDIIEYLNNFDSAISKSRLTHDITVYRGIRSMELKPEDLAELKGKIYSSPCFLSTSLEKDIAIAHTKENQLIFKINVPKGEKGLYVEGFNPKIENEEEVLLPRNTKIHIKSIEYEDGITIANCEVVKDNFINNLLKFSKKS